MLGEAGWQEGEFSAQAHLLVPQTTERHLCSNLSLDTASQGQCVPTVYLQDGREKR